MRRYTIEINGRSYVVDVQELGSDRFTARVNGAEFEVSLTNSEALMEATITPAIESLQQATPATISTALAETHPRQKLLNSNSQVLSTGHLLDSEEHSPLRRRSQEPRAGQLTIVVAPLPGLIDSVLFKPGERVTHGQPLLVLEAMKMRNTIQAPRAGVIVETRVQPGQTVRFGDVLVSINREEV